MTLAEVHVKWSVILIDLLGPYIFPTLRMKGQVLHRTLAHLKVPDCSLVWNERLTKKLPMFLSCLNEISVSWKKIVPVFESFLSNLQFLRMIDLSAWLWGRNVRVNGMWSIFSFWAVCSADCRSIFWARWWPMFNQKLAHRLWVTVEKVWNSERMMDARMNKTSNDVNLKVCSKH